MDASHLSPKVPYSRVAIGFQLIVEQIQRQTTSRPKAQSRYHPTPSSNFHYAPPVRYEIPRRLDTFMSDDDDR